MPRLWAKVHFPILDLYLVSQKDYKRYIILLRFLTRQRIQQGPRSGCNNGPWFLTIKDRPSSKATVSCQFSLSRWRSGDWINSKIRPFWHLVFPVLFSSFLLILFSFHCCHDETMVWNGPSFPILITQPLRLLFSQEHPREESSSTSLTVLVLEVTLYQRTRKTIEISPSTKSKMLKSKGIGNSQHSLYIRISRLPVMVLGVLRVVWVVRDEQ